jgi:hypothetical protein
MAASEGIPTAFARAQEPGSDGGADILATLHALYGLFDNMHSTDYLITISDTVLTQSVVRSWIKRKECPKLPSERNMGVVRRPSTPLWCSDAATRIQSHWRRFVQFSKFLIALDSSIATHAAFRS